MKKMLLLLVVLCLGIGLASCYAEKQFVLIDDFEGEISGTPTGTVDFGAGMARP